MRKFIPTKPLATLTCILSLCAISFIIINACRKTEHKDEGIENAVSIRNKFFTVPVTTNPIVTAIAQSIKRQDQQRNFVPELSEKAGYPVWNKAIIAKNSASNSQARLEGGGGETREMILIPFVKGGEYVTNAVLIVNTGDLETRDTIYKLLYGRRYEDYGFDYSDTTQAGAKNIFHLFSVFDNELFGFTKFLIKDRRIISGRQDDTVGVSKVTATLLDGYGIGYENRLASFTICNSYHICKDDCYARTASLMSADCPCGYYTSTICTTIEVGIGGGGIFGGGGGGGGGGGVVVPVDGKQPIPAV